MPVAIFWPSIYETVGAHIALPWEMIEARIANPKPGLAKEGLPRWALAEFHSGKRNLASFRMGHACMFDVDNGTTLAQLEDAFAGTYAIIHSTFNATESSPCWRPIVPLDRPTETVEEHDRVWRFLAAKIEAVGGRPEYSARSAAQPFAVPCRPPSGHCVSRVLRGAFTSVDEALAVIPKPEPMPVPATRFVDESYSHRVERASRYLACMAGAIQGSQGSNTTFRAAAKMVRGFNLDPADALRLLVEIHNPICVPQWSLRELQHKVRQATRSRLPAGFLAEKTRAA